jgi:hypothetical protein
MKSEVEFLQLLDGETDETALEKFKRKMIALGKEIKIVNSRRMCPKLMKIYFVENKKKGMQEMG